MNRKIILLPLAAAGLILAACTPTETTSSSIVEGGVTSSSSKEDTTTTSSSTSETQGGTTTTSSSSSSSSEEEQLTLVESGKLGLWQSTRGEALYFTGEMDGFYFGTTTDFDAAVTVNVYEAEGGVLLRIGDGDYIAARQNGTHENIIMQAEAYVWDYDEAHDAYFTTLEEGDFWIGNSQSYDTLSLNPWDYIDSAGNNIAHVVQEAITGMEAPDPEPVEGVTALKDVTAAGTYTVRGVVVGKNTSAILIHDGTGGMYAYSNSLPSQFEVGDYVEATGGVSSFNGLFQMAWNGSPAVEVTKVTDATAPTLPDPTALTAEIANGWKANKDSLKQTDIKEYTWTSTAGKDGNYTTLNIDGSDVNIEPVYLDTAEWSITTGTAYQVTAYFIGYYNYASIVLTGLAAA